MANYIKHCAICKTEFSTYNSVKELCSDDCRKIANRLYARDFMRIKRANEKKIIVKNCIVCKKDFNTTFIDSKVICLPCEMLKRQESLAHPVISNEIKDVTA